MKSILTTLALGVLTLSTALGQDEKKLSPAEQLLKITKFEENGIEAALAAFKPVIEQFKAQGLPAAAIKEIENASAAYFHQVMSDPDLKKGVIDLYNEVFEPDEIKDLLEFYKTPVGQKALIEMPKVLSQAMVLGQTHAEKYAPDFQKALTDILEKYEDGGEAPAPEGGEEKPE